MVKIRGLLGVMAVCACSAGVARFADDPLTDAGKADTAPHLDASLAVDTSSLPDGSQVDAVAIVDAGPDAFDAADAADADDGSDTAPTLAQVVNSKCAGMTCEDAPGYKGYMCTTCLVHGGCTPMPWNYFCDAGPVYDPAVVGVDGSMTIYYCAPTSCAPF